MNHRFGSAWTRRLALASALLAINAWFAPPAQAQAGPTAAEAAQYQGLHAAAWRGDVTKIERLVAAGANLNARDAHGRTPLHRSPPTEATRGAARPSRGYRLRPISSFMISLVPP